MGHWEYKGKEFTDEQEMAQYAVDNESYMDPYDFESWLDDHYDASEIVHMMRDAQYCDSVTIELEDDYNEWRVDEAEPAEEGEDYEFGEYTFVWVEDEEEDE